MEIISTRLTRAMYEQKEKEVRVRKLAPSLGKKSMIYISSQAYKSMPGKAGAEDWCPHRLINGHFGKKFAGSKLSQRESRPQRQ